jgi:hypothetical protein
MMNRGKNPKARQTARAASLIMPQKMKTLNDATIPLRVPASLKDALLIMAEKDDRSLSSFIKRELEKIVANATTPAPAANVATYTKKATKKARK